MAQRREKGTGTIWCRPDGRWSVQVSPPVPRGARRKRITRYATTREAALELLQAMAVEFGVRPSGVSPKSIARERRNARLAAAREIATHTPREWYALLASAGWACHYCGRVEAPQVKLGKDHKTPISRGGSDSIDNIVPACVWCNTSKSDATYEEFLADKPIERRHAERVDIDNSKTVAAIRSRMREKGWV